MARTSSHPQGWTRAQHSFAQVPSAQIPRSLLQRNCGHKTTFDSGLLIPVFLDEVLPGDTVNLKMSALIRLTTQARPFMDNLYLTSFFFAVPFRILWTNWAKFCGEQEDPGDPTDYNVPTITETPLVGSLSDYMGIPPGAAHTFNAWWHRAYSKIWNEWFRDENLQDSLTELTGDGPDSWSQYALKRRGKRHDYFSSCLPFTQKGTAVEMPLGSAAPVVGVGAGIPTFDGSVAGTNENLKGTAATIASWNSGVMDGVASWNTTGLEADLSAATAATINEIRVAFQVQKLLERDARGGSRLTEILRSHFGVISDDGRMQRPEYLGGGTVRIDQQAVASTADWASNPVGELASFAVGNSQGSGFVKSFTEHCVILGLVSVNADITYQQGIERMFSRQTRFDYYWPAFANLGEQAVLNKEIYADGTANDDLTWGFQERWAEYRYKPSRVSGKMRTAAGEGLDVWHLALHFASLPLLNDTFIQDNPPVDRVVITTEEPHWRGDFYFEYRCARPMPTYSVPGLVDHF